MSRVDFEPLKTDIDTKSGVTELRPHQKKERKTFFQVVQESRRELLNQVLLESEATKYFYSKEFEEEWNKVFEKPDTKKSTESLISIRTVRTTD
jgi:hypothetical protein